MSISELRALTEKKGCQVVIWTIFLAIAISMVLVGKISCGGPNGQRDGEKSIAVATIGKKVITAKDFDDKLNLVSRQFGGADSSSPDMQFTKYQVALDLLISSAIIEDLGNKAGIKITDDAIIDAQIEQAITGLVMEGKLKPGATRKDLETYYTSTGKDLTKIIETFRGQLKDGSVRAEVAESFVREQLLKKREESIQVSDDEVKADYDTLVLKQLRFMKAAADGTSPEDQAKKALADVRGGLDFDKALAKYAPGAPTAPIKLSRTLVMSNAAYKALRELKPGDVSEVVDDNGVKVVYKLVNSEQTLPKDFDKIKDNLKTNLRRTKAQKSLDDDIKKAKGSIKWGNETFKVLSEATEAIRSQDKDAMLAVAKKAQGLEAQDKRIQSLVRYEMLKLYSRLAPKEAQELLAERIEVGNSVLENSESAMLRLEIADLCIKNKDKDGAITQYLQAAKNNVEFENPNQTVKVQIETAINKGVKDKVFSEEDVKPIRAEITRWLNGYALFLKDEAKQKAEDAAEKRKAEEETKKEEEALKAKEDADKAKDAGKAPVAPKVGGK